MTPPSKHAPGATPFAARLISVLALLLLVLACWLLADLLVLLFAAVVLAVALRALAGVLQRRLHVPAGWSVPAAVLLTVALLVLAGWWAGQPLLAQFATLRERLATVPALLQDRLGGNVVGRQLLDLWHDAVQDGLPTERLLGMARLTLTAFSDLALILITAVYLAAAPQVYRRGLLRLVPLPWRDRVGEALDAAAAGLREWLLGQAISMVFVGGGTAASLWLLGVPLPLAVGLLAGLLAFIPFIGAIAAGVLAVMVAFIEGPRTAAYVAALQFAIQEVEAHAVTPFVQRWAVSLPPVLALVASIVFGLLFGLVGVFFATPAMVVVMILVRRLYVEGFLERGGSAGAE